MRTRVKKRREKVSGYFGQERYRRNLDCGLVGDAGGAISCGLAALEGCINRQGVLSLLALPDFSNSNPESHACLGAGWMGQQLRVSTALAEGRSPAAPELESPQLPVTPASGDTRPSSGFQGHLHAHHVPLHSHTHN